MKPLITNSDEFDQILHSMANGVTIQDPTGKLVFVNAAAAKMMNCTSPADAVKKGGAAILQGFSLFNEKGQQLPAASLPGRQALRGVEEPEMVVGFKAEGQAKVRWTSIKAMPVLSATGKVTMAVNVLQDITSLKETELRLREANDRVTELLAQTLLPNR